MTAQPASDALKRFTVIDLTRVRSGPTCVRQLADWGANVISVDMPELSSEPMGGPRDGSDFLNLHRNKRNMTLDLKQPDGVEILRQLVRQADVIVENFRPDVKHRLGIDYETLKRINPRLVYGSISGFGQDGPYANKPGFDQVAQGMGGLMSITGEPGKGPMRVGIPIADLTAGLFCAMGILTALLEREVSGEGQWVQTSLLQAQIFMLDFQAARWLVEKEVPKQAGNNHPTSIPTGVYPTSDGYMNIAASGGVMWQRLCDAMEAPEILNNPAYVTAALRSKNRDALNEELAAITRTRGSDEWFELLGRVGVPCGPIHAMDQVFANPQVKHLQLTEKLQTTVRGEIELPRQPMTLSRTPSHLVREPPSSGQHTDEILADLGYSSADIAALRQRHVV